MPNPLLEPSYAPNGSNGNGLLALLQRMSIPNPLLAARDMVGQMGREGQGILETIQVPGNVYQGKIDPLSDEGIGKAFDVAGFAMTGGFPAAAATPAALGGLGIVPIPVAKRINMPMDSLQNLKPEVRTAIENTHGAQLTPDGLQMSVERYQKTAQAGDESVRTGVFYLPEGAPQARHYKNNVPQSEGTYGGTEKIAGETLYKNPLLVKGGTGGKAPHAAFDQLLGKGSYDKMRHDAIHSIPPSWGKIEYADKVGMVERFLEKHAPEHVDLAEHIMMNSKGGNLLPYALQELAVANTVRKAGHDAVIGTTKAKGKPVLSEVFDVREQTYPTADGGFDLMPQFQRLLD